MRRWISAATIAVMATAGVFAVTAGPSAAGTGCAGSAATAPNGRIRVDGSAWFGQQAFENTEVVDIISVGGQALYQAKFKNTIPTQQPQKIKVVLWEYSKPDGYRFQAFANGENVTRFIRDDGSLVFPNVQPGSSTGFIDIVVKNVSNAELDQGFFTLHGRYAGTPIGTVCDSVGGSYNNIL
jgi:hypothetical protein